MALSRVAVGMPLNRHRRDVRLQWLQRHRPNVFPMQRWRRVLFSDESRFTLYRSDGRQRVFRRRGERSADNCIVERDRFGGGSVMVWGGICNGRKTPLVVIEGNLTAQRYIDIVLQPVVVPFVRQHNVIFQQDNARCHVARRAMDYLRQNNVDTLPWPPYSPDLSPIEHVWDMLDRRIRTRPNPPETLPALHQALLEEWQNIPMAQINRLVNFMHRRIRAATNANGGHTRY